MHIQDHIALKVRRGLDNNLSLYESDMQLKDLNNRLWEIVNETASVIDSTLQNVKVDKLTDRETAALLMLCNCLSDLIAGIHSLMHGFHHASGILFRACTENVAVAVAIKREVKFFQQYLKSDHKTAIAIGIAKQNIPDIGKLWGYLSNTFVHEPHASIGRSLRVEEMSVEVMLVPPIDAGNFVPQITMMNHAAMCALMIGETIEWAFADHLTEMTYWNRQSDGIVEAKSSIGKEIAVSLTKNLETLLKTRGW